METEKRRDANEEEKSNKGETIGQKDRLKETNRERLRWTEWEVARERGRDEQRQHRNTSNEDEQHRESVTEEELRLIDGSDKGEDECLTLTTVIMWPAYNSLPILATQWHHCGGRWALVSPRQLALLQLLPGGSLHGDVYGGGWRGREWKEG